jgi:hypothetical protein
MEWANRKPSGENDSQGINLLPDETAFAFKKYLQNRESAFGLN